MRFSIILLNLQSQEYSEHVLCFRSWHLLHNILSKLHSNNTWWWMKTRLVRPHCHLLTWHCTHWEHLIISLVIIFSFIFIFTWDALAHVHFFHNYLKKSSARNIEGKNCKLLPAKSMITVLFVRLINCLAMGHYTNTLFLHKSARRVKSDDWSEDVSQCLAAIVSCWPGLTSSWQLAGSTKKYVLRQEIHC